MRLPLFLALLVAAPAFAAGDQFSGAWIAWLCPAGAPFDPGRCANLVLEMHQKQDRLCGAHVYATAGAGQLDEGSAPSVTGSVSDGAATIVVESGRSAPPVKVRVEIRLTQNAIQWRRLESPEGDYLLPATARLTRSRHGSLLNPVSGQRLQAACAGALNAAPAPSPAQNRSASTQTD